MTTPQRPIGSGFGPRSTAADVLDGLDLTGRTALVTGGHSGLGLATTRALHAAGARVVVGARRPDAARTALADLPDVEVAALDLADQADVRRFAADLLDTGRALDVLVAGAGIMACPETRVGPGWEAHLAVNHLGHHTLVDRLRPALARRGARVVVVSSAAHQGTGIRWADPHFRRGYDKWLAYAQSKTANALFAVHLDALGADDGVRAFSVHPGKILTPLQRHLRPAEMVEAGWVDDRGELIDPTFKTPQQGAATQVWAATSPRLAGMGGVYCEDCDIAGPAGDDGTGVRDWAADPEQARRLWAFSADLTGAGVPA
jgi:NAD(P)-dependent dehydrogenase (short-subunit alcohol dehydrogenase family)